MLKQRILAAVLLAPLGIALLLFGTPLMIALVLGLIVAGGMREWARISGFSRTVQLASALVALVMVAALWWWRSPERLLLVATVGCAFWLLAMLWLSRVDFARERTPANSILKLLIGPLVMLPAVAGALSLRETPPQGEWWLLLSVLLVWSADTGAYFAGKKFGRRKLAQSISPGKTWEGVGGAILAVSIVAIAAGLALELSQRQLPGLILVALLTLAFSIVGDLFESLLKRHAGMKDSGTLIPGHGGVLDRFDSVFAALPVFAVGRYLLGA